MSPTVLSQLASPIGDLLLVTSEQQTLHALCFADHRQHLCRILRERYGADVLRDARAPDAVEQALRRYFAGELRALESLAVASEGTDLQRRVWAALRRIPVGTTTSYGKLAKELGFDDPRAAIDIGAAIGANPIAIVVPCHRVIGSNGDLTRFARVVGSNGDLFAWGLHRKRWLLEHENALPVKFITPRTARCFLDPNGDDDLRRRKSVPGVSSTTSTTLGLEFNSKNRMACD